MKLYIINFSFYETNAMKGLCVQDANYFVDA